MAKKKKRPLYPDFCFPTHENISDFYTAEKGNKNDLNYIEDLEFSETYYMLGYGPLQDLLHSRAITYNDRYRVSTASATVVHTNIPQVHRAVKAPKGTKKVVRVVLNFQMRDKVRARLEEQRLAVENMSERAYDELAII